MVPVACSMLPVQVVSIDAVLVVDSTLPLVVVVVAVAVAPAPLAALQAVYGAPTRHVQHETTRKYHGPIGLDTVSNPSPVCCGSCE
jgi:hypothetical protein